MRRLRSGATALLVGCSEPSRATGRYLSCFDHGLVMHRSLSTSVRPGCVLLAAQQGSYGPPSAVKHRYAPTTYSDPSEQVSLFQGCPEEVRSNPALGKLCELTGLT
jgi:hypothetical protein